MRNNLSGDRKISKKHWYILLATLLFLGILASQWHGESPASLENKRGKYCRYLMERVVFSLMEYVDKEGGGYAFPPSLATLVERGYLPTQASIACPSSHLPYHYNTGLRLDMPENLPILSETPPLHIFYSPKDGSQIPYGMMAFTDGTIQLLTPSGLQFEQKQADNAYEIMHSQDLSYVYQMLDAPNPVLQGAALWRLRQEPELMQIAKIKRYVLAWESQLANNKTDGREARHLQAALRQALYLLAKHEPAWAFPHWHHQIAHANYLLRRQAWLKISSLYPDQIHPLEHSLLDSVKITALQRTK